MISTVVALKFIVIFGGIFWYTARQSKRLRAEVAAAKAAEAAEALKAAAAP